MKYCIRNLITTTNRKEVFLITRQKSTYLQRKYGTILEELHSIEEIVCVVEKKAGRKLPLTQRKRGLVNRFGSVFPITSHDIEREVDRRLRRKW
jgi:hypothetical protein